MRAWQALAVAILATTQLGFVPPRYGRRAAFRGTVRVTITNSGDQYDLINSTDCIAWPSEEVKTLGGASGWKGWSPKNGDQGMAVAKTKHCFLERTLVFVKIGDLYVPMGSDGLSFDAGALDDLPTITKPNP